MNWSAVLVRVALGGSLALCIALQTGAFATGAERTAVAHVSIRHSRFVPARISVPAGTTVRFVITNLDPIDHEFLVGGPSVQAAHERGTEPAHGDRPGELSLAPGQTKTTTYRFPESTGDVAYACHLPGHLAYGMTGIARVRPD